MQQLSNNIFLQNGKYKIVKVLGQGGFGITYQGYNTEFEEDVAIKEFFIRGISERDDNTNMVSVSNADNIQQFDDQLQKFKKEARRLRKLRNKHIVEVYDLFEENGTAYYAMELLNGESLSDKMKEMGRPFTEQEVNEILPQVLDALAEVHQQSIWHLDLKPGNLMIDNKSFVKLIDFGASKQINSSGNMTTSTAMCYTPGFAPNEQVGQMFDRFGPWTDLYALGATLYKLLTGNKPPMSIDIEENGKDAFKFGSSTSPKMEELILWLMQPGRKARPQSVEQVETWLDSYTVEEDNVKSVSQKENTEATDNNVNQPINTTSEGENTKQEQDLSPTLIPQKKENEDVLENVISDDEEEHTILVIGGAINHEAVEKNHYYVNRLIEIGDFIFSDGSYSPNMMDGVRDNLKVVGILLSKYTGAHGLIVTGNVDNSIKDINSIPLEWHEATIVDWQKIIENLGNSKLYFENNDYHFYAGEVKESLKKFAFNEDKYQSQKSESYCYVINFRKGLITKEETKDGLSKLYVTEF